MPARVENAGKTARIILSGDLDFSTQELLGSVIDEALQSNTAKEIHVDMSDVTFIDSSTIRALFKLQDRARADGKTMSIWNCNEFIREVFVIGGFDQMFILH